MSRWGPASALCVVPACASRGQRGIVLRGHVCFLEPPCRWAWRHPPRSLGTLPACEVPAHHPHSPSCMLCSPCFVDGETEAQSSGSHRRDGVGTVWAHLTHRPASGDMSQELCAERGLWCLLGAGAVESHTLAGPLSPLPDLALARTWGQCVPCPDRSSVIHRTRVWWAACWVGLLGSGGCARVCKGLSMCSG